MRFLDGFLKFMAILLLIASTLGCTAVAMMSENVEAYIVMGCVWLFVLLVVLNIWGTGIALSNAAKNKKKIAQMEQKLLEMNYALAAAQARLQVYAAAPVATAPVSAAEGENNEAQPAVQPQVVPVAAPLDMPVAQPAAPAQKDGPRWVPAAIAGVAVVAVAAVAIITLAGPGSDPSDNNQGNTHVNQQGGQTNSDPTLAPTEAPGPDAISVAIGENIDNNYFTMTFDSMEIVDEFSYRTSEYSSHSLYVEDGYKLLMVRGKFTNNSTKSISTSDFICTALINGSYEADRNDVRLSFMRSNSYESDPYTELEYVMYVNIPEKLSGMFETADFNIYFNSDLSLPSTKWHADGTTTIDADTLYTLTGGLTKTPVAPGEEGASAAEEMNEKALPISLGESIDAGDYEFTLLNVELTYEVLPPNTNGVYTSYPAESGKVFVHVEADVKNTMQRDIRISELFNTSVIYDGKYRYTGFPIVNDGDNSFDWVSNYVAATPLETCRAHGLVECPVEVDTSGNSVIVYLEMGGTTYKYVLR